MAEPQLSKDLNPKLQSWKIPERQPADDKFNNKHSDYKNKIPEFYIPHREKDLYSIDMNNYKKNKVEYTPRKDPESRGDIDFYKTFYQGQDIGIFADYDDMVAEYTKEHPEATLQFDRKTGRVTAEDGTDPLHINGLIVIAQRAGVPLEALDVEGSVRRVEERDWFGVIHAIPLSGRGTTLYDLDHAGLLRRVVSGVTGSELLGNRLDQTRRKTLRKFYIRRQMFWHPDKWDSSEGLSDVQQKTINEMAQKVNRLSAFI